MSHLVGIGLQNMRGRFDTTCVNWILFIIAYAYGIRLVIIWFVPELVYWTVPEVAWPAFDDPDVKIDAIWVLLIALLVFCSSVIVIRLFALPSLSISIQPSVLPYLTSQGVMIALLLTSVVAAAALNTVAFTYGIGYQGRFIEEPLPFKLAGAVVYAKAAVLPSILLLQIYLAEARGKRWLARLGAIVMVVLGFIDMFMFDSRGAALKHVLLLALVWWLSGFRLRSFDRIVVTFLLVLLLAAIQMVTSVRLYGVQTEGISIDQILKGLYFVLFRITGVEQFMAINYLGLPIPWGDIWDVLTSPRGIPGYYTTVLLCINENVPQTFAPSGIGWLYLLGGFPGIIVGAAVIGMATTVLWGALERAFSCCAPVVKSFYLITLLVTVAEGSMEAPMVSFLIVIFTLKTIDLAGRTLLVRHTIPQLAPGSNV